MNLWFLLVPIGAAALVLFGCLVLAACGVDGFHGDGPNALPAAPMADAAPEPVAMPQRTAQGPIRVTAERVTQVEAA